MPAFTAAIVLLLNIWGGMRSSITTDPIKEMLDAERCMNTLKACEDRQVLPVFFPSDDSLFSTIVGLHAAVAYGKLSCIQGEA